MSSSFRDAGGQPASTPFQHGGPPDFLGNEEIRHEGQQGTKGATPVPVPPSPVAPAPGPATQAPYGRTTTKEVAEALRNGTLPGEMVRAIRTHAELARSTFCHKCKEELGGETFPCKTCPVVVCAGSSCRNIIRKTGQCVKCQPKEKKNGQDSQAPAKTVAQFEEECVGHYVLQGGPEHEGESEWEVFKELQECIKDDNLVLFKKLATQNRSSVPKVEKAVKKPKWESWYRTPLRLGMSLLHLAIESSAVSIVRYLLKLANMEVAASTTGPTIHGREASTPPLQLAVLAAAKHGCDRGHASWTILELLTKDARFDPQSIDFDGRTATGMAMHYHANPVVDLLEGRPPQPLTKLAGAPRTLVFENDLVYGHKTSAPDTEPASEDGIRIMYVKEGLQPLSHRNQVAFRHGSLLTRDDLRLVHSDVHLCNLEAAVAEAAKTGPGAVHVVDYDGDTWVSAGSLDAAKASAGLVDNAITSVLTEDGVNSAYCLTRPPGHHAGPDGMPHTKCAHIHSLGKRPRKQQASKSQHREKREGEREEEGQGQGEEGDEASGSDSASDYEQPAEEGGLPETSSGFCLVDNMRVGARKAFQRPEVIEGVAKLVGQEGEELNLAWLDTDCHRGNGGADTMRRAQASAERWELRTSSGRVIRVRERKYDTFVRGEYVTFDHEDNVIIQEFYAGGAAPAKEDEEDGWFDFPVDLTEHRTPSSRRNAFREHFKSIVAKLRADRPHVLFWSVGVDNNALEHATSPAGVGGLRCKDQADLMRWIRQALPSVRIVIAQEGGYAVQGGAAGSLPRSMYALVNAMSCPEDELLADSEDTCEVLVEGEEEDLLRVSDFDVEDETSSHATAEEN